MRGRRAAAAVLALALLVSGCGWMDGSYVSVTLHQVGQEQADDGNALAVSSYSELQSALVSLIDSGSTEGLFSLADYPMEDASADMARAKEYAGGTYPIGAYAVEDIDYEFGTAFGSQAISVDITYRRSREEIGRIRTVRGTAGAQTDIAEALTACSDGVVMQITEYRETDFEAFVRAYAMENPDRVMEVPEVEVSTCPDRGSTRVVELHFTYRTDPEELRAMREQVQPVFSSAALYVSGQAADRVKLSQLYTFLTERFEYTLESSVTPAYSLLCQGVGDSRAFAEVYAAMCSRIGLEVLAIQGTWEGESHWWNLACVDGQWYHVDLLSPAGFRLLTDGEMTGHDWDRSAVPTVADAGE